MLKTKHPAPPLPLPKLSFNPAMETSRVKAREMKVDYFPPSLPPLKGMNGGVYTPPERVASVFDNPPVLPNKPLTYTKKVNGEDTECKLIITDSVMRILQMLSIFNRLTLEHFAHAFSVREDKSILLTTRSLRNGSIGKMVSAGLIKRIDPPNDKSFYILTELGSAYCDQKNLLETELLNDNIPLSKSFHADTHYLILNKSTVGVKLLFGQRDGFNFNADNELELGVPIITENEMLTAYKSIGLTGHDAVKIQESGIMEWITKDYVGVRDDRNLSYDSQRAVALRNAWLTTISVQEQHVLPAFLNCSFNSQNSYESIIDFVILHENIHMNASQSGNSKLNGSVAVIVEPLMQSVEYYEYKLFEIFASRIGYSSLYCFTPYQTADAEISAAWANLVRKNMIPKQYINWLQIKTYRPINSGQEVGNFFNNPTEARESRNWSQG